MALCDMCCERPGWGTLITAEQLCEAVERGFNPFKLGLLPGRILTKYRTAGMDETQSYQYWRQRIALDATDWNICSECMLKLKPYLEGSPSRTEEHSSSRAAEKEDQVRPSASRSAKETFLGRIDYTSWTAGRYTLATMRSAYYFPFFSCVVGAHLKISSDGRHVAGIAMSGRISHQLAPGRTRDGRPIIVDLASSNKYCVVLDGKPQPSYREIGEVVFSPDGRRLAYAARRRRRLLSRWVVIIDGQERGAYPEIRSLCFSDDGQHVAYAARRFFWFIVHDAREGTHYRYVRSPRFSPDSERLAYGATLRNGDECVVVDGVEQKHYPLVYYPKFSPDSKRVAYPIGFDPEFPRVWRQVVVDGEEGPVFDEVDPSSLCFSSDSQQVAYFGKTAGRVVLVRGTERTTLDGAIDEFSITFSPDGRRVAYVIESSDGKYVVIDNEKAGPYSEVHDICFSPDSQRVGCVVEREGQQFLSLDGTLGKGHSRVFSPYFSPDSKHIAYMVAEGGRCHLMIDGDERDVTQGFSGIVFSPDSSRVAYKACVRAPIQGIGGEAWRVVVADVVSGRRYESGAADPYDYLLGSVRFDGPRHFRYLAVREDDQILLVEEMIDTEASLPERSITPGQAISERKFRLIFSQTEPPMGLRHHLSEMEHWQPIPPGTVGIAFFQVPQHADISSPHTLMAAVILQKMATPQVEPLLERLPEEYPVLRHADGTCEVVLDVDCPPGFTWRGNLDESDIDGVLPGENG